MHHKVSTKTQSKVVYGCPMRYLLRQSGQRCTASSSARCHLDCPVTKPQGFAAFKVLGPCTPAPGSRPGKSEHSKHLHFRELISSSSYWLLGPLIDVTKATHKPGDVGSTDQLQLLNGLCVIKVMDRGLSHIFTNSM